MNLKITLINSTIGQLEGHKRTIKALGLRKRGSSITKSDTPAIRGMINKVKHLIAVEESKGE